MDLYSLDMPGRRLKPRMASFVIFSVGAGKDCHEFIFGSLYTLVINCRTYNSGVDLPILFHAFKPINRSRRLKYDIVSHG